jgi:winged helix-turn-helix protein
MTVDTSATQAEDFSGRMLRVLNSGMLALLVSIGHRTRLFELLASSPPTTAAELAEAAGLDERYVREWLGGMTIGRVVVHDPVDMTFWLPPEHCIPLEMSADGGMGLGSMWGEQLTVKMLNEAGFSVEVVHPEDDWNYFYIATKWKT